MGLCAPCRFPGEESCWGDTHEYRLCRLPVSSVHLPAPWLCLEDLLFPCSCPQIHLCHPTRFSGLPWGSSSLRPTYLCPQDCPLGAIPFRDLQCALYNGHPVLGTQRTYQWVPFYGGE